MLQKNNQKQSSRERSSILNAVKTNWLLFSINSNKLQTFCYFCIFKKSKPCNEQILFILSGMGASVQSRITFDTSYHKLCE